jgi:hypothetical protein
MEQRDYISIILFCLTLIVVVIVGITILDIQTTQIELYCKSINKTLETCNITLLASNI